MNDNAPAQAALPLDTSPKTGRLVVVSGPSGSGKTTICDRLLATPGFQLSVSATTRPIRPGEVEGREYHYLSRETFERWVEEGRFLEWAEVYGNLYGTPKAPIDEAVGRGTIVLLNIDTQGARSLREQSVDALFVFLLPPSLQELEARLRRRATDSDEVIARRLRRAQAEMDDAPLYDIRVTNDDLDPTVHRVREAILATLAAGEPPARSEEEE
ncbi:MAG: guanylate kinase [Planctomycetota bacterium]|jgi:guanylate kinase